MTVRIITGLWLSMLLGASILWAPGYGYDEKSHIDYAYQLSVDPFLFPAPGELRYTSAMSNLALTIPAEPSVDRLAKADIQPRGERPTFAELGGTTLDKSERQNQMSQHPPLFYWLEAIVLKIPGVQAADWSTTIWLMRMLSVLLVAPIPLLCFATSRTFIRHLYPVSAIERSAALRMIPVVAAVVPLLIPNLIRVGSAVGNDALLMGSTSVFIYGAVKIATGTASSRAVALTAVAMAVALWSKGFALVVPVVALACLIIGIRQRRKNDQPGYSLGSIATLVAGAAIGGVWWLRNILLYSNIQPEGRTLEAKILIYGPPDGGTRFHIFAGEYLGQTFRRIWGGIGFPDVPELGPIEYFLAGAALVLVVVACLGAARPRAKATLASVLLIPFGALLVAMYGSWGYAERWSHVVVAAQGRYLYHGVVAFALAVSVGVLVLLAPRCLRRTPLILLAVALVVNFSAWTLVIRSWYAPKVSLGLVDRTVAGVHGLLRWSPLPGFVTILVVFVLPFGFGAWALVQFWRDLRSEPTPPAAEERYDQPTPDPQLTPEPVSVSADQT